jgi:NAD(P)-dependent dehydrogenase (short-subunit alcohol dehydrogenase family)
MGRIGTPEECAEAIVWLCSGEAAYTIGAILPMTGGR